MASVLLYMADLWIPDSGGGGATDCGAGAVLAISVVDTGPLDQGDRTSEGDRTTSWPDALENLAAARMIPCIV